MAIVTDVKCVALTETQIRRIVFEELLEHYLVQRELWGEERSRVLRHKQKSPKA